MDRYTKIILTVIAVLLALHLIKPFFIPMNAGAINNIQDVNIAKFAGYKISVSDGIPVHIKKLR